MTNGGDKTQYSREMFHKILDDVENGDGLYEYDENDDSQNDMTRHVSWLFNSGYLEYNESGGESGTISGLTQKGISFLDELNSERGIIRTSDGFTFFRTDAASTKETALTRCIERLERSIAIAADEGKFCATEKGDIWENLSDGRFDHLRQTMINVILSRGFRCSWDENGLHVVWIQIGEEAEEEANAAPQDPFAEAEMESAQAPGPAPAEESGEVQINPAQFMEQSLSPEQAATSHAPNNSREMTYLKYLADGK